MIAFFYSIDELHETLCKNPRTLELIKGLTHALHGFARQTKLTHAEWAATIDFLTRAGKISTPARNEFVLLSDTLGLSVLIDELEHPKPEGCTEGCEPGPFFIAEPPIIKSGGSLSAPGTTGERMWFSGSVRDTEGSGIPDARVNVWQADGDGLYDVQYSDPNVANDRGCIPTEHDGTFNYRGILPTAYPIPSDGPVGDLLKMLGRHPHRSSHLHFHITAPGYDSLTSALYPSHSPFLGTDPVFATRKSLICELVEEKDPKKWKEMGFENSELQGVSRIWVWKFDFVLPTVKQVEDLKKSIQA
ncbi:aromatic compound dioxygenase [Sistotremastrum suecicum HHB10207 ss-3]|uniref:Aromatic compound dioxygenase n=1 Tax=Sistotremastrum suecicum HHB10207 ss-3 TaxID=1314776 RepID=A0A166DL03_9AGAM|nr:aromatic compound dioxygenase [Sistotremastrum suecicum HHB10207 ss-3]